MVLFVLQNETAPMSKPETNHPEIEPFITKSVILSRKKDLMNPWVIQISSGLNPVCVSWKSQKKETDDISADRKWRQQLNYDIELI